VKFFLKLLKTKLCRHDWTEVDRFLEVDEEQEREPPKYVRIMRFCPKCGLLENWEIEIDGPRSAVPIGEDSLGKEGETTQKSKGGS